MKACECFARVEVQKPKQVKIGLNTIDCILIGYTNNSSTYRFFVHKLYILNICEGTIIESRNIVFFENICPRKDKKEISSKKRIYNAANETLPSNEEQRYCKRTRTSTLYGPDFLTYMVENDFSITYDWILNYS